MQKILPLVFAISLNASPVLAWGEGECSFSKKNKTSQEPTIEQVENSDSSDK
tara:strand:+ start:222 stop:377 length:156 start_codon:yes stop_codon:yes gene_type:complete